MSIEINLQLVTKLIVNQFPQYKHLPIKAVELSGIDNRTFRLGDEMLIRLPSAEGYAAQAKKEQEWLPKLAPHLSTKIPTPLENGKASADYPWNWSIYNWIAGSSANSLNIDSLQLEQVAIDLAKFITELHTIDTRGAPLSGLHNYYRGSHPSIYDKDARSDIVELNDIIDPEKALAVWEQAISSKWKQEPVWVHGDVASGNILIKDNKLTAVIDFGCMGIGDPACDLVIAWTFFKDKSRQIFQDNLNLDHDTWARARGWALWKADFELAAIDNKNSVDAMKHLQIINTVLDEM